MAPNTAQISASWFRGKFDPRSRENNKIGSIAYLVQLGGFEPPTWQLEFNCLGNAR